MEDFTYSFFNIRKKRQNINFEVLDIQDIWIIGLNIRMKIIGITGGICSGKSTAATILKNKGIEVIDADKLGHVAYLKDTDCFQIIVKTFGEDIIGVDGEIDRRKLGAIVFSSPVEMNKLTNIVWPEIRRLILKKIQEIEEQAKSSIIVIEAALMIEAKWYDLVSSLWVIVADPDLVLARLMKRNNFTEEEAKTRIAAQLSNDERKQFAHHVITNNSNSELFEKEVLDLFELEQNQL